MAGTPVRGTVGQCPRQRLLVHMDCFGIAVHLRVNKLIGWPISANLPGGSSHNRIPCRMSAGAKPESSPCTHRPWRMGRTRYGPDAGLESDRLIQADGRREDVFRFQVEATCTGRTGRLYRGVKQFASDAASLEYGQTRDYSGLPQFVSDSPWLLCFGPRRAK